MLLVVLSFTLAAFTGWVMWSRQQRHPDKDATLYKAEGMRFLIPLRGRITLENGVFVQHAIDLWGEDRALFCFDMEGFPAVNKHGAGSCITDFSHWAVVKFIDAPIDAQQVESIIDRSPALSVLEQADLRAHEATLVIEAVYGTQDPVARARFAVKTLLTLMHYTEALGYVVQAHGGYWPREVIEHMCGDADLNAETLLVLLTRIEQFQADEQRCCFTHLHGMEQFALPDFRVKFTRWRDADYYRDLLHSCAVYALRDGQCMAPGEIAELRDDGVIYRIDEVPVEERSHFGRYGALTLVRLNKAQCLVTLN